MYAIEVSMEFCAAHQLRLADGSLEPLHGHNWRVEVRVVSKKLDAIETVMDFHQLESLLRQIVAPWQNKHLNDFSPFNHKFNPTAERVAQNIAELLIPLIPTAVSLEFVRISEAPGCFAIYFPDRKAVSP
jgi:6-pyruvoyltetrahydropterin/6-carboxytetrahydropterin synthase